MRIVPKPEWAPHQCCVTMRTEDPEGFIATGMSLPFVDPSIDVSIGAVRMMGRLIGLEDPASRDERIAALEAENADLRERLLEAERFQDAAEYTLQRFGTKVKNKPGRKPNEKVAA
jgi:hypothetical protein